MIKLLPYYLIQIDAIESWLDDQAKKGLFLTEFARPGVMHFEKGEPRTVRYRIDVKRDIGTYGEKERIADYQEFGWRYVCELAADMDVYRCDDPDAPELNTDEETLHEVLDKKLRSRYVWNAALLCTTPLWLILSLRRYSYGYSTGIYDQLLSGFFWLYVFVGLMTLTCLITLITYIASAAATRKRRLLKRTYHSPVEMRRWRTVQLSTFILPALALVIFLATAIGMNQPYKRIPVDEFPAPTVSEVFSDVTAETQWATDAPQLLCSHIYLRQEGPNVTDPETGDLVGSWYYNADIYRLAWRWLANGYAQEQARAYGLREITVPGWTHAWYSADNAVWGGQTLILQNGREVWEIGCDHEESLLDALDLFAR